MQELKQRLGTAIVLITHDLGVIAEMAERVVIMYAGRKVEEAPVEALFDRPRHPYTVGLLGSVPKLSQGGRARRERLSEIPGMVPSLMDMPAGCAFAPRCALASDRCRAAFPPFETKAPGHAAACWHSERAGEARAALEAAGGRAP
jgi:oligopeptide/dipeptide ABC transporter ATP-binding protein